MGSDRNKSLLLFTSYIGLAACGMLWLVDPSRQLPPMRLSLLDWPWAWIAFDVVIVTMYSRLRKPQRLWLRTLFIFVAASALFCLCAILNADPWSYWGVNLLVFFLPTFGTEPYASAYEKEFEERRSEQS